ncbi:hypothetical protein BN1708_005076 [Verticillium longisporum]|uniref:DUF6603 domain-containing protein n=1 Tax=Verticillium longisporum TaxID=100787 RepID=A0A0G4M6W5_VERLO|nr:hypothetical protein BN1708_005076 [Verticillium longisporum]
MLRGKLWAAPKKRLEDTFAKGLPKWESYLLLEPNIEGHALDHIDLKALLSLESLPPGVPSEVRGAELQIDSEGIQFTGLLACSDLSDDSKVPMLAVEELELSCRMTWADKTPHVLEMRRKGKPDSVQVLTAEGATWRFSLQVDMLLMPMGEKVDNASSDGFDAAARIRGEINYGTKMGWRLLARMDQLKVSHLVSFWDRDSRDGAMSLLKDLRIDYIELRYLYLAVSKAKTSTADRTGGKSFRFLGALSFGDLQLRLNFNHDGTQWQFGANLGLKDDASGSATVKTLLDTTMGVDVPKLPDVIADVVLAKPGNENEVLGFKCAQVNIAGSGSGGSGGRKLIVFTASVQVASISLTFVQWRDTSWQSTTPSKRIIKVSIGDMGDINAPLVGKLKQPFDQLVYMWVSDKATAVVDKAAKPGVTKGDLDALLPGLEHDQDKLFFKYNKEPNDIKPNEIVIEPGSHFMVVATNSKGLQAAWLIEDGDQNDEDVSKAAFKVSAGPLVFENIGLKYIQEENRLGVVLDASFLMGPIVAVALPSQNPTPQLYLARLLSSALLKVEAQLSPRSFVLHERYHLTGGLALFSWFGDSPHAGDRVMTIGGFHQAFDKPLQYPRPPRLGIAWSLGDNLRITGEAYFAITPRVCMGGGRLHAQLTLGALSAWFDAFLDFLINYRPFCFAAVGGVSIGVRFSLDLWLVTIRISCEIGTTLTVAGPPMAGTVHVDFWVFGFDVDFGDKTGMARPDRLSLSDFKALALKSAPFGAPVPLASGWLDVASGQNGDDDADDFDEQEAPPKAFLFNCVGGLVPEGSDAKGPEANAWYEDKPAKIWLPYISRDAIPKFNLVEDLKLTVDSKGFPFKRKETASPMWAPRHQDGSWNNFKEKWQSQPDSRPEEAVCLWAERLKFKGLTGLRPKALLKRFDDIVPALPLITVGTGS